ncbi:unnamed protein product [Psylliodes chrysocephalus]|uniref:MFS transporter n=1 Tax=Psylliodes chrysocephalus TaxID=3402493 RepID=A0A9P0G7T4_9CUCU|nr:unnamed protein product [Psylliodes chrysocephala]
MAVAYIIFALDLMNTFFYNAVFVRTVLGLKGSYTFIGIAGSCSALLCFLWKPIAGSLSDKRGTSKLLTWCLFAGLIAPILTYASQSLKYLFLCRLLLAFSSPSQVLLRTIITNNANEKQSEALAKLGMVAAVFISSAALIIGFLLDRANGLDYIYGIMVVNAVSNLILTQFLPSSEVLQNQAESTAIDQITTPLKNLKTLSTSETYCDIFLSKALVALSFGIVDSNAVLVFMAKGITGEYIGYLVTMLFFNMFLVNILQGRMNKMFYKNDDGYQRALHASIIIVITLLAQGFSTQLWIFVMGINIMAFFRTVLDNSTMENLLKKVNVEEKATVMSSFDSIQSLTELTAPLVAGLVLEYLGIPILYLISAILFAMQCSLVYKRKNITNNVTSQIKKEN